MDQPLKKIRLKIHGMHCASCEVLVERKFKEIPGVDKVHVNHATGKAKVFFRGEPQLQEFQNTIRGDGYTVSWWGDANMPPTAEISPQTTKKDYVEIGAIFLIVVALYLIFKQFDLVPKLGISENMSYGFVLVIGLVAATSTCIAVTGGLLLAVAGKYNERNSTCAGFQKFKPHMYFNMGRIVSYALLGGAVGALGSVLTLSSKTNGIITILASMVMMMLGFQLLKIFPWLKRFTPKMPKFLAHKIHDLSNTENKKGPFLLGAATFFLPCGFTQALQLYVLSKGDFVTGALTMFFFALGTLPALLSLSVISSFTKGAFQRYFVKFAGVVVVMLGLFNINNGLVLAGSNVNFSSIFQASGASTNNVATDPNVNFINGKQVARMKITGLNYGPHRFTVVQGIPVEWQIDGIKAVGCAQIITVPKLGITEYVPPNGIKKINFTPDEVGEIRFSCSMGMTTRNSAFTVIPNTAGIIPAEKEAENLPKDILSEKCNPQFANCIEPQKVSMEISAERGFYPNTFTVKKGILVELTVDDQVPLGGCMGVMTIPKYEVAKFLQLGKNTLAFIPTETGIVPIACSSGMVMGQFNVID